MAALRIQVRLSPKSSANRIDAVTRNSEQQWCLRAKVTAPPDKGQANTALIQLLAKTWHVRPSGLSLVAGQTDRNKLVEIDEDIAAEIAARLEAWPQT